MIFNRIDRASIGILPLKQIQDITSSRPAIRFCRDSDGQSDRILIKRKKNGLQGGVQAKGGSTRERKSSINVNNDTLIFAQVNTWQSAYNRLIIINIFKYAPILRFMQVSIIWKIRKHDLPVNGRRNQDPKAASRYSQAAEQS
ncbi:MAG TPA: hypothetical protein VMV88_03935, partial [Gallionella sp.]|nr:hypothetical protein [Gallionella sp.]